MFPLSSYVKIFVQPSLSPHLTYTIPPLPILLFTIGKSINHDQNKRLKTEPFPSMACASKNRIGIFLPFNLVKFLMHLQLPYLEMWHGRTIASFPPCCRPWLISSGSHLGVCSKKKKQRLSSLDPFIDLPGGVLAGVASGHRTR